MLLNGSLNVVTDYPTAIEALRYSKVLYVGESNPEVANSDIIPCSILLPPVDAVAAEIDNNMQAYVSIYGNYLLTSKTCYEMFATIFVALHQGINVTLFIQNPEMAHFKFLMQFFADNFGILVGSNTNTFTYDMNAEPKIAAILYTFMDGYISDIEFLNYIRYDLNILRTIENNPFIGNLPVIKLSKFFETEDINELSKLISGFINRDNGKINLITFI